MKRTMSITATLACVLAISSAPAEEEVLKFKLVTRAVDVKLVDAPGVEGHSVSAGQMAGVAFFEDGRIADKQFVTNTDIRGKEGTYVGYSTYTFQNGDSLTLRFEGGWGKGRNGGDYEVLSGTGAYAGATGTGRFDSVKEPWEKASLFDGTIKVVRGN